MAGGNTQDQAGHRTSNDLLRLEQVLRKINPINPILRGWAAYFRYGASEKTFSYLGYYFEAHHTNPDQDH